MIIYFLPTSYPDETNPQKDIFIYEQAKKLSQFGHKIIVLHVKKLPTRKLFSKANYDITEIDDGFAQRICIEQKTILEHRLPAINKNAFICNMDRAYQFASKKYGKPDVLYAHFSCWAGYAGVELSRKYDIPLVTLEHFGGLLLPNVSKTLRQCVSYTVFGSRTFMCVSENLKGSIVNLVGTDNITVMPNMIDSSFSYFPRNKNEKFTILSIGNLNKGKDFETLIRAFDKAFNKSDKIELRIGGGGPEKERLELLIRKLGRDKQICLLGKLTREQTLNEYRKCDCFAMASKFETYGMVYREALVTGRPIVTTNHGGFGKSDWHEEYGIMVPVHDVVALSEALKNIYNDYDKYNGAEISKLCIKDCSSDIIGKKIECVLISAIKKGEYNE